MKKLLIIIIAFFALAFSSCKEKMYGDFGIVVKVEKRMCTTQYPYNYTVTVNQETSRITDGYKFNTCRLYQVGDTIEIVGRKYK